MCGKSFGGRACGVGETRRLGHCPFLVSGLCGQSVGGRACGARETRCPGHAAFLVSAHAALAVASPDPRAKLLCFVVPASFSEVF